MHRPRTRTALNDQKSRRSAVSGGTISTPPRSRRAKAELYSRPMVARLVRYGPVRQKKTFLWSVAPRAYALSLTYLIHVYTHVASCICMLYVHIYDICGIAFKQPGTCWRMCSHAINSRSLDTPSDDLPVARLPLVLPLDGPPKPLLYKVAVLERRVSIPRRVAARKSLASMPGRPLARAADLTW